MRPRQRNVYLKMTPVSEARELFLTAFDWLSLVGSEEVAAVDALGRVTAAPVFARLSAPSYASAAMDGIAVRAEETWGASDERPRRLRAGQRAHAVNTGAPLPAGTDAVVMVEHVQRVASSDGEPTTDRDAGTPGAFELRAAAFPGQHVRRVGEDIVAHELLLPRHHRLGPADLAALITAGVFRLPLLRRPRVAILPTGSELLTWHEVEALDGPPAAGAIIDSNTVMLAALVRQDGGEPLVLPPAPDEPGALRAAIAGALESGVQLVVVNAGASAGSRDFTPDAVRELGQVLVHGIAAMPGKPTLLGQVEGRPVVGAPGYPLSAWVCHDQFIRPALAAMAGQLPRPRTTVQVVAARRLPSRLGHEEFLRVHLGRVGDEVVALPLKRGAGAITSLTRADGLLRIPADSEGIEEGARQTAELLSDDPAVVDRTLVVVGSHDVTLDHLADHLRRGETRQLHLSTANVGSLAGLLALRAGRCHLAGTHLLDPDTGEYNVSYVERHLPDLPVRLVTLALREQGLMLPPGNPKRIRGLADLARDDVRLINRQAGSGTRVLLDHHLARAGISPDQVRGYCDDEYTHMAVAVAVLSDAADVGLGILAAARALGLDFIPIASERYDLCIPERFVSDPRVDAVLQALASSAFRQAVRALGGYDVSSMGAVAWRTPGGGDRDGGRDARGGVAKPAGMDRRRQ